MARPFLLCSTLTGALLLSGCSGGGGTYATFMPTPTPTPTPTPAPTPSPTPATVTYAPMHIFSGLASNTNFTTLGYDARTTPPLNSPYTGTFAITYDAASNSYSIASNAISGRFYEIIQSSDPNMPLSDANALQGDVKNPTTGSNTGSLSVLKPQTNSTIQLTYSTIAVMREESSMALLYVAFGFPTPAASVPLTGSATYAAKAFGRTDNGVYSVGGNVTLNFNFGAGTLSGYFDPTFTGGSPLDLSNTPIGHYAFTNTVYSTGSATFSGSFVLPTGLTGYSAFDGQFTGPAAQELIARFQAPYSGPLLPKGRMYGVWVGGKQ